MVAGGGRALRRLGGRAPKTASAVAWRRGGPSGLATGAVDEGIRALGAADGRVERPPLTPLLHSPAAVRRRKAPGPLTGRVRVRGAQRGPQAPGASMRLEVYTRAAAGPPLVHRRVAGMGGQRARRVSGAGG